MDGCGERDSRPHQPVGVGRVRGLVQVRVAGAGLVRVWRVQPRLRAPRAGHTLRAVPEDRAADERGPERRGGIAEIEQRRVAAIYGEAVVDRRDAAGATREPEAARAAAEA